MKKLIYLFVFLPLISAAQMQVNNQKQITVAKSYSIELLCVVTNGDTAYNLTFRDGRYKAIHEYKVVPLSKGEVLNFADALIELSKEKYKAKESNVTVGGIGIYKEQMLGGNYLMLLHKAAFTNFVNLKKSTAFADDIYDFMGVD